MYKGRKDQAREIGRADVTEILTLPIFQIRILKLHLDGENVTEILNLGERMISHKGEEEADVPTSYIVWTNWCFLCGKILEINL